MTIASQKSTRYHRNTFEAPVARSILVLIVLPNALKTILSSNNARERKKTYTG